MPSFLPKPGSQRGGSSPLLPAQPRPEGRSTYVIAYDIRDPARLRRVHRRTLADGLRLNYSIYAADLFPADLSRLSADLAGLIDPDVDDVRLYPVPDPPRGGWSGPQPLADDIFLFNTPAARLAARLAQSRL